MRNKKDTSESAPESKPLVILSGEIKSPPFSDEARIEAGRTVKMDKAKKVKLEKAGIVVTDASEWLGLSKEEEALVEIRVNLAREVERLRRENGLTQKALAEQIGTKQPAVARMVSNPSSTTIDSLMKALLSLGSTPRKIAALL